MPITESGTRRTAVAKSNSGTVGHETASGDENVGRRARVQKRAVTVAIEQPPETGSPADTSTAVSSVSPSSEGSGAFFFTSP